MKKIVFACILLAGFSFRVNAQNTWNGSSVSTVTTYGDIGVGTNGPIARLHAQHAQGSTWKDVLRVDNLSNFSGQGTGNVFSVYDTPLLYPTPPSTLLFAVKINQTIIPTSLRIGAKAATAPYANYKLSVDGDMIAKRCVIQVANWADYVFKADYKLPALTEVETYIDQNGHLPGVPCEADVLENGMEVGEMNTILLQKVEELTLYIIEMQKRIQELENSK